MGTWGSENFDNDHALDYLTEVRAPLVEKLIAIVENPSLAKADEDGWVECLVAVEMLTSISAQCVSDGLTSELVTACRDTLLTEWLASIDELDPTPDYKAGKQLVI
ncbi:MAG: DUF4259 domain-containing protein [Janthinobacterium lividum]